MNPVHFCCDTDKNRQNVKEFLVNVNRIDIDLNFITKKQVKIATFFYPRTAPLKDIQKNHTNWAAALLKLSTKIKNCHLRIKQQSEQLPFLEKTEETEETIKGWKKVSDLEQKCYRIKNKNENLKNLLQSADHQNALIFYKKIIQACEDNPNISVQNLEILIEKAEEQINTQQKSIEHLTDQQLRECITTLHQETLRFLLYASKATPKVNPEQQPRIEKLLRQLQPIENIMADTNITDINWPQSQQLYFKNFKNVTLKNEHYFKNGIYAASWRYPIIYPVIQKMQETAKGLQKIETDVEQTLMLAWQGIFRANNTHTMAEEVALYNNSLKELKKNLHDEQEELYSIPFCAEVHSGLHYAASLLIWANEIRHTINFFEKIAQKSWQTVAATQQSLYKNLREPTPTPETALFDSCESTNNLFKTVFLFQSISSHPEKEQSLQKCRKRAMSRITTSITLIGKVFLPLSSQEKIIENTVPNGVPLSRFSIVLDKLDFKCGIESLIGKKIINHFHFTKNLSDLSLDLFLTSISTQKIYKMPYDEIITAQKRVEEVYDEIEAEEMNIGQLIKSYNEQTKFNDDKEMLSILIDISGKLKFINKHSDFKKSMLFCLYAECQQKLLEASKKTRETSLSEHRLETFITGKKRSFSEIQRNHQFPDYCAAPGDITIPEKFLPETDINPIMYKLLLQALWAVDETEMKSARTHIDNLVNQPICHSVNEDIKYLLKNLAFNSFCGLEDNELTSDTIKIFLPSFLANYVEDPISHFEYPAETIELILHDVFTRKDNESFIKHKDLIKALGTHRTGPFFDNWKIVVASYTCFLKENNNQTKSNLSMVINLFETRYNKELTDSPYYEKLCNYFQKKINQSKTN